MKMGQVKPHGKSCHGSYTPEKFQSNGSPGGNGERQEQISRARGGKDPRGAARMLSGTSYLLSPHYWALSRVPANTETFPCEWAGRDGTGRALHAGSPQTAGSWVWPLGIRALLLLELPAHSRHNHYMPTPMGKTNCSLLACPARGMSPCCRCESPSKGRPRLWSL